MLFISYATRDISVVERLVGRLEGLGLACWYAARDIAPSEIFAKAISDAMQRASGCVVVVSEASLASDGVLRELELASSAGKRFLPVLAEPCQLTRGFDYYLSVAQWTDLARDGEAAITRLAAAARALEPAEPAARRPVSPAPARWRRSWRMPLAGGGIALAAVLVALAAGRFIYAPTAPAAAAPVVGLAARDEAQAALRKLDVEHIEGMIRRGWDPNMVFDNQDNRSLHLLMGVCEWNPGHDRQRMLLMTRTLMEAGGRIDIRNTWGDTPYSIAKARRYCGPDHPVTKMMKLFCSQLDQSTGDRCLAAREVGAGAKAR